MSVFPDTDITSLSASAFANLTISEIKSLSSTQCAVIVSSQLSSLSADKLAALPLNFISTITLTGISTSAINGLILKNLSNEQIQALTTAQITAMSAKKIANFLPEQLTYLTMTQIAAADVSALNSEQISALSASQLSVLSTNHFSALSNEALEGLTASNITGLSATQINALSSEKIAVLKPSQLNALSNSQFSNLNSQTLAAISCETLNAINESISSVSNLTPQKIGKLTAEKFSTFTPLQISSLTATQAAVLKPTHIAALSAEQASAFSTTAIAALKPQVIRLLNLEAFDSADIAALTTQQMSHLTATNIAQLSELNAMGLTASQINVMKLKSLQNLSLDAQSVLENQAHVAYQIRIGNVTTPNVPTINTIAGDNIVNFYEKNTQGVVISGTADIGTTVRLNFGNNTTATVTTDANGLWAYQMIFSNFGSDENGGINTLSVVAVNNAGTTSQAATTDFVVDVVAPSEPEFSFMNVINTSPNPMTSVNNLVFVSNLENGAGWEYSIDGGATFVSGTDTFFSLPIGIYSAGTIKVKQIDAAGNVSAIVSNNGGYQVIPPPQQIVLSGSNSVDEGSNTVYTVSVPNPVTGNDVTVSYTLSGSATQADYDGQTTGILTIPADQTTATLTLPIISDNLTEGEETLIVTLSSPSYGYAISSANGSVTTTINDTSVSNDFSVTGELSETDSNNSYREGSYVDIYELTGFNDGDTIVVSLNAIFDAYLQIVRNGEVIAQDDDSGEGFNSSLAYTYQTGDLIYATSFGSGVTGSYTLTANRLVDDFPDSTLTTGTLDVSSPATGNIDYSNDKDWFAVSLTAGTTYLFTQTSSANYPFIDGLFNSEGLKVKYSDESNYLTFTPTTSGMYYLSASGEGMGSYQLSVNTITDDFTNNTSTTGIVTNGVGTGNIDYPYDRDWLKITLTAGATYHFNIISTNNNASLEGIYNSAGAFMDYRLDFTPTVTGDYFIEVYGYGIGAYTLNAFAPPITPQIYNNHTYILSNTNTSWQQAQEQAIFLGGNLVTINDELENNWLVSTFGGIEQFWIGLTDEENEGNFVWISGENATYRNWATSPIQQPDNFNGNQNYGVINWETAGKWDDEGFADYHRGIIELTFENFAPTATGLDASEIYTEDTALNLNNIVVADSNGGNIIVTLTLSNPIVGSFNTTTLNAVTSTYNSQTGVWQAKGAIADVNALLADLTFTPTLNFNGNFTVTTHVSDGLAPALVSSKSFTGIAVNDAPTVSQPPPVNSIASPTTGNYYLLSATQTWQNAEDTAIALGGHLVTIDNQEEQDWLVSTFGGSEHFWIGLTDKETEGTFKWISNDQVVWIGTGLNGQAVAGHYTNWNVDNYGNSEPNNSDNEDYTVMNWDNAGKWNDLGQNNVAKGIIEISGTNTVNLFEDTTRTFQLNNFGFDIDGNLASVTITNLPASGVLKLGDIPVVIDTNNVIPIAQIPQLAYTPPTDAYGTNYATIGYTLTDTENATASGTMTLNVIPVDDAPVFSSGETASIEENSSVDTVVYVANATDVDGDILFYSLKSVDDYAAFNINSETGEIRLNSPADYETKNSYSFTVQASDEIETIEKLVLVSVLDIVEGQ